jgi:hypothetical protein
MTNSEYKKTLINALRHEGENFLKPNRLFATPTSQESLENCLEQLGANAALAAMLMQNFIAENYYVMKKEES